MLQLDISDINQHADSARKLLNFFPGEKIFLFDAEMGSGKTTFIKTLCKILGSKDAVSSPTYSIVNEYHTDLGFSIFHFDLYRLKSSRELFEIGFEDYLLPTNYLFIEWPEYALPFLDKYVRIIISKKDNNRYISAEKIHL